MNHDHNHSYEHHMDMPAISPHPPLRDYIPLGVVIIFILIGTLVLMQQLGFTLQNFLGFSMGFFFLIFAMFKLMDLTGFSYGYREYDLIAQRIPVWGYIYPFIEATLGILYLLSFDQQWLHIVTIILAVITVISVGIKLAKHEVIQCTCLGTVLKVPLTYVSLIEYAAMGVMAAAMLFL